jgi:hypothetical protein
MSQYYDALDAAFAALGVKAEMATKGGCPFGPTAPLSNGRPYPQCRSFNDAVFRRLLEEPPAAVLISQADAEEDPAQSHRQRRDYLKELEDRGVRIIFLLDNPHPTYKGAVYECVTRHPDNLSACAFSRKKGVAQSGAASARKSANTLKKPQIVDLSDYICLGKICPAVIGDVLVYRGTHHLSNTYARTLSPVLTEELRRAMKN